MAWHQAVMQDDEQEQSSQWSQAYAMPSEGYELGGAPAAERSSPQNDQSFSDMLKESLKDALTGGAEVAPSSIAGIPGDLASLLSMTLPEEQGKALRGNLPSTHELESMFGYEPDENVSVSRQFGRRAGRNFIPMALFALLGGPAGIGLRLAQTGLQSLTSAAAGQATKELGGGPWAQLAAEVAGGWAGGKPKPKAPITSAHPEIAEHVTDLEKLGVSPTTRKIAKMGAEGEIKYAKAAAGSYEAEKALDNAGKELSQKLESIKQGTIKNYRPGDNPRALIKADMQRVRRTVERSLDKVQLNDVEELTEGMDRVVKSLKNKTNLSDAEKAFIEKLNSQKEMYKKGVDLNGNRLTAGHLMRDYIANNQSFNKFEGKMISKQFRAQQENLKKAIYKADPKAGRYFEQSNVLYQKYLETNKTLDMLEGLIERSGRVDYGKLANNLDKPEVRKMIITAMGEQGLKDLSTLADASKHVDVIEKAFHRAQQQGVFEKVGLSGMASGLASLLAGSAAPAAAAGAAAPWILGKGRQQLAVKVLTDPHFQAPAAEFYRHLIRGDWKQAVHALNKLEPLLQREEQREHEVGYFPD